MGVQRGATVLCEESQKLPHEYEVKILAFQRSVIRLRQSHQYEMQAIGNMHETPMTFDMPLDRTVDAIGKRNILVKTSGHEKDRFTLVLACLANGTKLKPMVILKRKTMPKQLLPSGVVVHVHPRGWMDG